MNLLLSHKEFGIHALIEVLLSEWIYLEQVHGFQTHIWVAEFVDLEWRLTLSVIIQYSTISDNYQTVAKTLPIKNLGFYLLI